MWLWEVEALQVSYKNKTKKTFWQGNTAFLIFTGIKKGLLRCSLLFITIEQAGLLTFFNNRFHWLTLQNGRDNLSVLLITPPENGSALTYMNHQCK